MKIGVLDDQSGPFATDQGIGSVIAAKMAIEDYGGKTAGTPPVDIASASNAKFNHAVAGARIAN